MASGLYQLTRAKMLNPIPSCFIASSTNATPIAVTTATAHGLATGDVISIVNHLVNTNANGPWTITRTGATTFTLDTAVGNGVGAATGEVLYPNTAMLHNPNVIRWGVGTSGNLYGDNIKCVLVDSALYTVNLATHEFYSDVSAGVISTSSNFSTKTVLNGIADADDITFTAVTAGTYEALVIYKDSGTAATSPLIAYLDSAAVTGLPVTSTGGNVSVAWDSSTNKIFKV